MEEEGAAVVCGSVRVSAPWSMSMSEMTDRSSLDAPSSLLLSSSSSLLSSSLSSSEDESSESKSGPM